MLPASFQGLSARPGYSQLSCSYLLWQLGQRWEHIWRVAARWAQNTASTSTACLDSTEMQHAFADVLSFVLHIDKHLNDLILQHGKTTYLILWSIVFCETGLVLTPFLPGDSLLFTAGTFAARGSLDLGLLMATFLTSAILGDAVNYAVGKWLGEFLAEI